MQMSGGHVVPEGMPATAIAINFVWNGTSITEVEYPHTFGCGDPLWGAVDGRCCAPPASWVCPLKMVK